jgi:hypothetical protein
MPSSPVSITLTDCIVRCLIGLWQIMIGLIAAIIIAPMLTGFLFGLCVWPTNGLGDYLRSAAIGALLFLYIGIATSLKAVVCVVVPGITLARWIGIMSPATCIIGGGIVCMFRLTGYSGFTASPLPLDWKLLGVGLFGGGVAGFIYWWIAERAPRGITQSSRIGCPSDV